MAKTIGVVLSERITAGLVVDHRIDTPLRSFPPNIEDESALVELHAEGLIKVIAEQVLLARGNTRDVGAVGLALPGLIRNGVVEEAPNLPQLKGARIAELLTQELAREGLRAPVNVINDADGMAAGLAATYGKLSSMIRVWTLGIGIGFGRYPFAPGVWEGGHTVVTLDDKETYCGCGGRGHIEGIMGHRAMRLRFLDMEPEEVFAEARKGPAGGASADRCLRFVRLWHKALAAGTATSIHLAGGGKFYLTGFNVRFVDLNMLKEYLHQMIKMSPLQGYTIEIIEDSAEVRVLGAAVAAEQSIVYAQNTGLFTAYKG
jgi:predicted NBD/HSP70 family sugar kinase